MQTWKPYPFMSLGRRTGSPTLAAMVPSSVTEPRDHDDLSAHRSRDFSQSALDVVRQATERFEDDDDE
jgi:hypothetical protein